VQASGSAAFARMVGSVEIIGTIWINAIRMTVIPLVAALTIASVARSGDAATLGKLGMYAVAVFAVLLLASGFFTMLVVPFSLDRLEIPPEVAARLRESVGTMTGGPVAMPSLAQRIIDIVPVNPIKAAADGTILSVVVFSLALGLALTRLTPERREPLVEICRAISDALLVLVQWVLRWCLIFDAHASGGANRSVLSLRLLFFLALSQSQ